MRWDNTRTGAGILAHYQADNGEQLVVELSEQDDSVWLSRAIYADASGAVRVAVFDRGGAVAYVDNNGAVNRYVQIADFDVIRFVENTDVYRPVATAYLAGESGLQNASKIHPLHASRINDIAAILQRQMSSTVTEQDRIQLAAHLMSLFGGINCAGVTNCSFASALSGALDLALADEEYRDGRFSTQLEQLGDQLCLNLQLPANPCPSNRLLANLLALSSNRVQTYVGRQNDGQPPHDDFVEISVWTVSDDEISLAKSQDRNLGPYGKFEYAYRVQPEFYRLNQHEVLMSMRPLEFLGASYADCEVLYVERYMTPRFDEVCNYHEADSLDTRLYMSRARMIYESFFLNHAWVLTKTTRPEDRGQQVYCVQPQVVGDAIYQGRECHVGEGPDINDEIVADKTEALQLAIQQSKYGFENIFHGGIAKWRFANSEGSAFRWSGMVGVEYRYRDPQLGVLYVWASMM